MDATPKPSKRSKSYKEPQRTTVSVSLYADSDYVKALRLALMTEGVTVGKWLRDVIDSSDMGDKIDKQLRILRAKRVQSNDQPRIEVSNS